METSYLHSIIGALGAGGLAIGAMAFLTKRVLTVLEHTVQRVVDDRFDRARRSYELQLEVDADLLRSLRTSSATAYVALSQLCYKAKLGAEKVGEAHDIFGLSHPDLIEGCRELTTNLICHRIYLDEEVFNCLHRYKHTLQDLLVACDVFARLPLGPSPKVNLELDQKSRILQCVADVLASYDSVNASLSSALRDPERRLSANRH